MRDPGKAMLAGISGGACLIVLAAMLLMHAWPLWTGQSVYLRVQPVDPRDLFRGDYVILSYDINRLLVGAGTPATGPTTRDLFPWDSGLPVRAIGDWAADLTPQRVEAIPRRLRGQTLYVQLEQRPAPVDAPHLPAHHLAESVSDKPQRGALNLRGIVRDAHTPWYTTTQPAGPKMILNLHYGIDAWFVPEGQGRAIEDAIRRKPVYAEVAVTPGGKARVRNLIIQK